MRVMHSPNGDNEIRSITGGRVVVPSWILAEITDVMRAYREIMPQFGITEMDEKYSMPRHGRCKPDDADSYYISLKMACNGWRLRLEEYTLPKAKFITTTLLTALELRRQRCPIRTKLNFQDYARAVRLADLSHIDDSRALMILFLAPTQEQIDEARRQRADAKEAVRRGRTTERVLDARELQAQLAELRGELAALRGELTAPAGMRPMPPGLKA